MVGCQVNTMLGIICSCEYLVQHWGALFKDEMF